MGDTEAKISQGLSRGSAWRLNRGRAERLEDACTGCSKVKNRSQGKVRQMLLFRGSVCLAVSALRHVMKIGEA